MSSWMNDAAAVQNHNGTAFNHLSDPNAGGNMLDPNAFMANPNSFDPSQMQNHQLQQRLQNGGMRNGSPAFNTPVYQTNPIVPSKRPRPREDGMGTSPRQAPGMLPNSRSQTPQQAAYPGFPAFPSNSQTPQHASQSTPYSHLQHNGSTNASPSPIMGNQLRPGAVPQRVSTASPHPFSPAAQQFGAQGSPSQSDHGNRVDTPQGQYMQHTAFGQGYNQNFTSPSGGTAAPAQGGMSAPQVQQQMQPNQMYQQPNQQQQPRQQNLEHQKMMYQMRLQQTLAQNNLMAAQRMQNTPPNPNQRPKPPMQATNGQYVQGVRPQQPPPRPNNPEQFMKHLTTFMQSRGLNLDLNPIVGDRSINLVMLYMAVTKFGGYRKINVQNGWAQVAQALQFNPMQNQSAPQQLKGHYERNLMLFEEAYAQQQQRAKAMMQQQQSTGGNVPVPHPQMSPTKQMNTQGPAQHSPQYMPQPQQQHMLPQQSHQVHPPHVQGTPVKQMTQMNPTQQPAVNGFSTPQMNHLQSQQSAAQMHARNSLSRSVDPSPPQHGPSFGLPSPAPGSKQGSLSLPSPQADTAAQAACIGGLGL